MSVGNGGRKGYTHLRTSSTEIGERSEGVIDVPHDDAPELVLLRRVPDSLPAAAWLIILAELCERFAYFGLLGPFQNYIQNAKNGGLGLGQANATRMNMGFLCVSFLTPIAGAIVADQYLGRLYTILYSSGFYITGLVVLITSSLPAASENGLAVVGLLVAMLLLAIGAGGIKPSVGSLIAEQYTEPENKVRILKTGERVVLDTDLTVQRIFIVFYLAINVGSLSALITPVIEQRLGFTGAFALPAFVFLVAFAVLFLGKDRYKSFPPEGSIMTKAVRYLWLIMTSKGSFARAKEYVNSCHAAGQTPPWDDDFAADLHLTLQACKILCFYPMYWLVFAQSMTSLISQAAAMETHGIPNDLLVVLNPIAILVLGPTFEFFVYPALHRIGIQFQPITRIACGFIFIGLSMAYAAALQYAIYASPPCYSYPLSLDCEDGKVPNQIHVLVQAPIYVLGAIGEILGVATGYEYAFKQAPLTMRSLVMAVFLSTAAVALALGMIIAPFFTDPTLVWGYSGLSVAAFFTGAIFWKIFGGKVRSK